MFDVAVLTGNLEYCISCIGYVPEPDPSWFGIIGKLLIVVRIFDPKRAF